MELGETEVIGGCLVQRDEKDAKRKLHSDFEDEFRLARGMAICLKRKPK